MYPDSPADAPYSPMRPLARSLALLGALVLPAGVAAQSLPFVYDVEDTGFDCEPPPLPDPQSLAEVGNLPDPFAWSDGSGRVATVAEWRCRRSEIAREIQHYETGRKPPTGDVRVTHSDGALHITVTEGDKVFTLTAEVSVPSGTGPFPAVIGVGLPTGSLPSDVFTDRNVATIRFDVRDVTSETHNGNRTGPFYEFYQEDTAEGGSVGKMAAWAWGVSRVIDALEISPDLGVDTERLAVTGCSFAGKISLFAGALDERIALTIAQEPGGGGAAAWRVSDALPYEVETLGRTNGSWFRRTFVPRFGAASGVLPYDHHELMALVAPRALLVLNNPGIDWLAAESANVSNQAAQRVWAALSVPDRFGYSIVESDHCRLPDSQRPQVEAFVDAFLLGDATADTDVTTTPYDADLSPWITWDTPALAPGVATPRTR